MSVGSTERSRAAQEKGGGRTCAWVFMLGHGGGIVSGDRMRMRVDAREESTAIITTQASSKIFQSIHGKVSRQGMVAKVEHGALLAIIVDPVVPYARSRYIQRQKFFIAGKREGKKAGSLLLIDWFTSGRHACGEVWEADYLETHNDVFVDGQLLVHDAIVLDKEDKSGLTVMERMLPFNCYANVILLGPRLASISSRILSVRDAEEEGKGLEEEERAEERAEEEEQEEEEEGNEAAGRLRAGAGGLGTHGEGLHIRAAAEDKDELPGAAGGGARRASKLGEDGVFLRVAGRGYMDVEGFLRHELDGLVEECGEELWKRKYSYH
ncbi:hypothetical protein GUITHDRAFT_118055 [Guillardia theta CCMP2712]|uniref:Urease accessory protein UreD n=1 Tax=Guillardia theta (strain CCMP2712) TaxID=905079 RepID=L1II77_GUITC|nr:hypothetical protein GUITHDRAFT_118055 [Guillardia theta CCMP2712]EKX35777.1 hypothetical protein GUITHDRAFT_118055 [Guillardia theta CCMP2712]|eukprot:XP_005822757.1 hypothetical protein GUITHDRAFT_118055 [Guillardia theta CCMP2712]